MAGPGIDFMLRMQSQVMHFVDSQNNNRNVLVLGGQQCPDLTDFSADDSLQWCMHGTSLSTAYKCLFVDCALRAGKSTDRQRTGVFFIGPKFSYVQIDVADSFQLAHDRAKCRLCTEWRLHGAPSVWSMPVCLMFQHRKDDTCTLQRFEIMNASKQVIRREPGKMVPFQFGRVRLLFDIHEYYAWKRVHQFTTIVEVENRPPRLVDRQNFDLVMCGGRLDDPVYWSRSTNNVGASCGRACRIQDLEAQGWRHALNAPIHERIYRCPKCHVFTLG